MSILHRRRLLQAGCASALVLGGVGLPSARASDGKLVVQTYGGRWEKFWRGDLLPGLKAKTGIEPTLDVGLGKNFVANLRASGGARSPYSLIMINENVANILRAEGYFEPIPAEKVPNLAKVYPILRNPDNNGVRGIISPIGIGYRTDLVKTPPKSWTDLWANPEFKGKIGLYQIGNTAAVLFLLVAAKVFGGSQDAIDVAFKKVHELLPFQQVDWSGTLSTLLVRGDVTVAPIDTAEIAALKQKGVPVEVVVPSEGAVAFEQSFNIVKTGDAKEDAYKYIDYVLGADIQARMAQEFFTTPSNVDTKLPPDLAGLVPIQGDKTASLIEFDWTRANAAMPTITERWNREMV